MTALLARVALACLVEPGNGVLGQLVRAVGPETALEHVLSVREAPSTTEHGGARARLTAVGVSARARLAGRDPWGMAEEALRTAERLGARLIIPGDPEWPTGVEDLSRLARGSTARTDIDSQPPLCLWVRGAAPIADTVDTSVSLVGSRSASPYGLHLATEIGYGLAERDWTVVSGGAYGIDAAAHRGALAAHGRTVAVLACGIDTIYPLGHAGLFEQICERGLLITEWPPGAKPFRTRFLIRNRLIAALSRGTTVVEAGARSGARSTARRARQLGRALMACPGPVTSATSVGCHIEIRENHARLVTTPEEILEEVGSVGEYINLPPRGPDTELDSLDTLVSRLFDAVPRDRPITATEIAIAAGVSPDDAQRNLPDLVSRQLVVEDGEGRFRMRRVRGGRPPARP